MKATPIVMSFGRLLKRSVAFSWRRIALGTNSRFPSTRAGVLFATAIGTCLILAIGRLVLFAAECHPSGNTYWTWTFSGSANGVAEDGTNIYATAGTVVAAHTRDGGESWRRDFTPVTLGKPLPFHRSEDDVPILVVGGSDGFIYGLNQTNGATLWSRSLRRLTCGADSLSAAPVVQLRSLSDSKFQVAVAGDVVIVGTDYGCSITTANKVFAVAANTGNVLWTHNATAPYQYDRFTGLVVDYLRNRVYATAYKTDESDTRDTVIALNTLTGARLWGRDYGRIESEPVLANGGIYVASTSGTLYKVNPTNGTTIWAVTNLSGSAQITLPPVFDETTSRIYVVDTDGTLHAFLDICTGVTNVWNSNISGNLATAPPGLLSRANAPKLYLGTGTGRIYQLNAVTGAPESWATINGISPVFQTAVLRIPSGTDTSYRLVGGAADQIKYICIPWSADGIEKSLAGGPQDKPIAPNDNPLVSTSPCEDPYAPESGLTLSGDIGPQTSFAGEIVTRSLSPGNATCYPFQCVELVGVLPHGLGIQSIASTNASTSWDTESFLLRPIGGLPVTASLTLAASVPGTYLTSLTLSNAGSLHTTVVLTNYVLGRPPLSIVLNGSEAEVSWSNNAAGFHLECAASLTSPADWHVISNGITSSGGAYYYLVADSSAATNRFYRLGKR
jgi:outer membrane protein assembly factor BamB